ncbi:MAG: hypothetical protein AAB706_04285 [Patescibacteria group bacterium]
MVEQKILVTELPDSGRVLDQDVNEWVSGWQNFFRIQKTVIFIDAQTFAASTSYDKLERFQCGKYRFFDLIVDVDVTGTPTLLTVNLEFSDDGITWYKLMNGPFGDLSFGNAAGDLKECIQGKINSPYCRITATVSGTDASNTFKLTAKMNFSG